MIIYALPAVYRLYFHFFGIDYLFHNFIKVYSGGRNDKGQLGINRTDDSVAFPNEVDCLRNTRIEKIACGCNHVLALSTNGELFTWGCNNYGQLGMGFAGNSKKIFPYKLDSSLRYVHVRPILRLNS